LSFTVCMLAGEALGQDEFLVLDEGFSAGNSSFVPVGGFAAAVVDEVMEVDFETRGGGTTFNNLQGPIIRLESAGIAPLSVTAAIVELDLLTVGDNSEEDTAFSFLGNDQLGFTLTVLDDSLTALGTYGGGEFFNPRFSLADDGNYNFDSLFGVVEVDLQDAFPTGTHMRATIILRENALNPDLEDGDVIGLDGNDLGIDNVRITLEGTQIVQPMKKETVILLEDFEDGESDFIPAGGGSAFDEVVEGGWNIDFEERQEGGTNFNNFDGPLIDLAELNVDPAQVTEIRWSVELEDLTGDPTASYIGGDIFNGFVTVFDEDDNALGRYPVGQFFDGFGNGFAGPNNYGTKTVTRLGDLITQFPTAAKLRPDFFFRENAGTVAAGIDGADFRLDDIQVTVVETIREPAPAPLEVTVISFDPASNEVDLAWRSTTGESYNIFYSTSLEEFPGSNKVNAQPIQAEAGDEETGFNFAVPDPVEGASALFFRVTLADQ